MEFPLIFYTCLLIAGSLLIQYRCFQDICNSAWQYCEENEKRCATCNPAQCQKSEAERIFNQCRSKCNEWLTTTSAIPISTISPVQPYPADAFDERSTQYTVLLIYIAVITSLILIGGLFLAFKQYRHRSNAAFSRESLYSRGSRELNQPLISVTDREMVTTQAKLPIQINTEISSGQADNMMHDADILNEATVGRNGQSSTSAVVQPQH